MKALSALTLSLIISTSVSAYPGPFAGREYANICKGFVVRNDGYTLICKDANNSASVLKAKVGKSARRIPSVVLDGLLDPIWDLAVLPDPDTNLIYQFRNTLVDQEGKIVGYQVVDGLANDETNDKLQLNHRYNLKGELVSAAIKL